MLYDRDFLLKLDKQKNKIIYAKITALTFAENPIQTIEGRVTQGSINIDGASAVRRTCSLTIVGQNFDYNNYYWGLNTKFKLEIGVQNFVDSKYPDIIWFKQGVYLITGFNTSRSTSNFSISINGKDKMCLLNGEVGGSLESSVDFGKIDEESEDGIWTTRQIPLIEIIKNAVHTYGGEPYHNIIINDLDTYGKELMEYRLDVPAYIYKKAFSSEDYNIYLDGNKRFICWSKDGVKKNSSPKALNKIGEDKFDLLIDSLMLEEEYKKYYFSSQEYSTMQEAQAANDLYIISKMQYGDTIGYRRTDLTFAGDLIANVGESVTSVLDKIKNMLVEFEYFYDLDGRFIFQKKRNYIRTMWGPEVEEENQKPINSYSLGDADYVFSGGELITSFNNNPNLLNIRNDFSIWGERTGISGAKIPIHLRYAIDDKPTYYRSIFVDCETDKDIPIPEDSTSADAIAILNYNKKYKTKLRGQVSVEYTTDDYDWREIIYRMALDYYKYNFLDDFELKVAAANPTLFPSGRTGYEHYYTDLQGFWRELYNLNPEAGDTNYYTSGSRKGWNKTVFEQPYNLNFWFDFLDTDGELKQFGIKSIGARPKSIKDTNIKAIYFRDTPEIEFVGSAGDSVSSGYSSIQVPEDYENIFSISGQGKSAKDKLDELLYQHGYCIESATINTIPIYYLEPNSRIYINDSETNIIGYYNVSKISLPLTYNGTMSLTATKVQDSYS